MKEIVLVCTMGISTAFTVRDMMKTVKKKNLDITIKAVAAEKLDDFVESANMILLTPPMLSSFNEIKEKVNGRVPVIMISADRYIKYDGEAILEEALLQLH